MCSGMPQLTAVFTPTLLCEATGGTTGAGNDLRLQQLGSVSCAESVGSLALSLDWSLHPTAASSSQVSHAQSRRAAELTAVLSSAAFCA